MHFIKSLGQFLAVLAFAATSAIAHPTEDVARAKESGSIRPPVDWSEFTIDPFDGPDVRSVDLTENPSAILSKRQGFDCRGSSSCGNFPNLRRYCDDAVNSLMRGAPPGGYEYGASDGRRLNGNCRADGAGNGCGVFLEGNPDCKGRGDDLWWAYQQVRASGCQICGSKYFVGEGGSTNCRFAIDYVTGCPNR